MTPLHCAVKKGYHDIAFLLLKNASMIDACDNVKFLFSWEELHYKLQLKEMT